MIRPAGKSDYAEMDEVFRASAISLCSASYTTEIVTAWVGEPQPERFEKNFKAGCAQYVTVKQDRIICFAEINLTGEVLQSLFVLPEYAGKGIGQTMLNFIFELAKENGLKKLTLDSSINAANFYSRNGFKEIERFQFPTQSGVKLDAIRMECQLTS